jgi:SAM-dependent methyltransferase
MDSSEFKAMVSADEYHWWYRGRRRIVRAELDRLRLPPGARILDAGCGSGRMLDELADYGRVAGIDQSAEGVTMARSRGHHDVSVGSVEALPYPDASFDLVTSLDVIEHTPKDAHTLREYWRVTRPGGHLLVTVPAYQWLWSSHDVVNQHYRRYRGARLRQTAIGEGWTAVRTSYFNALLFLPAAAVRLWQRGRPEAVQESDLSRSPAILNSALELPLRVEARLLRLGVRLPFGMSLLALFEKAVVPELASQARVNGERVRTPAAARPPATRTG